MMDCRVQPGNDKNETRPVARPTRTLHASPRTDRLFGHRRPPAAEIARWAAADRLAAARARGVGHGPPDGAHGDLAAAGPADAAGPSQLELARVRHAGRLLAAQAHDAGPADLADRHA